jgi:hypothetical protein
MQLQDNTTERTMNASMYWTAIAHAVTRTSPPATEKLTREEHNAKSDNHKFGLCPTCHKGLDDKADFIVNANIHSTGFSLVCTPCYYNQNLQSPLIQPFN